MFLKLFLQLKTASVAASWLYLDPFRNEAADGRLPRTGHNPTPLLLTQNTEALQVGEVVRLLGLVVVLLFRVAHIHGLAHGIRA